VDINNIKERIYSIDFLRGVVMMLMMLDHTRDFVHHGALQGNPDPTDPVQTTIALFFTRWITHYCAPTFVFLSGVSIYLQKIYGKTNGELARFLLTRGLWLIVLEFTVVRLGIVYNFDYTFAALMQVIWVIGISMIVMAALVWLPTKLVGAIGVLMIVLHNLLDGFQVPPNIAFAGQPAPSFSQSIWMILHQQGVLPIVGDSSAFIAYPLIPWIGVMAAGYALGTIYGWDSGRRRKWLLGFGLAAIVLFIGLRYSNLYGDTEPWKTRDQSVAMMEERKAQAAPDARPLPPEVFDPKQPEPAFTILAFLNTQKYPPSLLFLLMTLGPSMLFLGLLDRIAGKAIWQRVAIVFGRVPLFFYLLQFPLAHLMGIILSWAAGKDFAYLFASFPDNSRLAPPNHGFSLEVTYLAWIAGLIILFPLCYFYGEYKRKSKHWLLSYL
jgi:uncharacterized membrane protein